MSRTRIDYFFAMVSPWSYLGHGRLLDLAARHGAEVAFKPFDTGAVFKASGGLPLKQRPPQRQAYRLVELQRWRSALGLELNLHPRYFPADPSLAHRLVLAALEEKAEVGPFIQAGMHGVWVEEANIADPDTLIRLADRSGLEGARLLARADESAIRDAEAASTQEAIDRNVFGAPFYILNGEPFWGQDRLGLLEGALASGRPPFLADAPS